MFYCRFFLVSAQILAKKKLFCLACLALKIYAKFVIFKGLETESESLPIFIFSLYKTMFALKNRQRRLLLQIPDWLCRKCIFIALRICEKLTCCYSMLGFALNIFQHLELPLAKYWKIVWNWASILILTLKHRSPRESLQLHPSLFF